MSPLKSAPPATTFFAPAERQSEEELLQSRHELKAHDLMIGMLEAFPGPAMILNGFRQVVAVNRRGVLMIGQPEEMLLGKRPGELLGCQRSAEGPGGCGTAAACSVCGAVQAILHTQNTGEAIVKECRIPALAYGGVCLELEMHTTSLTVAGHPFVVCALRDLAPERQNRSLERLFFHDVLNSLGIIKGLGEAMMKSCPAGSGEDALLQDALRTEITHLTDEVLAHRHLMQAETGELQIRLGAIRVRGFLDQIARSCQAHECARNRHLVIEEPVPDLEMASDERLLRRILVNLAKNALEAIPEQETVKIRARMEEQQICFEVWNPGVIPQEVQYQIFQKSFSTKGVQGRGIGTYCARLLGESCLHGRVSFTSTPADGTCFSFRHPLDLPSHLSTST